MPVHSSAFDCAGRWIRVSCRHAGWNDFRFKALFAKFLCSCCEIPASSRAHSALRRFWTPSGWVPWAAFRLFSGCSRCLSFRLMH